MLIVLFCLLMVLLPSVSSAQWDQTEAQIPHLRSLEDSTDALQKIIDDDGNLQLAKKFYRITRTLEVDLVKHGAVIIQALNGSTLVMDGAGPALRIFGDHQGTASPKTFVAKTWNQRMPIVRGFEILGANPDASGIELESTVGAIVNQVSVRWCKHGIHLRKRNRNVLVSDCHLYENSGVGVFLDDVNLHQINITNSHVSYNRQGGVVVRDGNVRNVQISGCDIEGNMPDDETPTKTANVLFDVSSSENDRSKSIAEISITGCTIQHAANYGASIEKSVAPGGANIRLAGKKIYPINSVTISGNVLSDTSTNIDIEYASDVAISANNFFAPKQGNLDVRKSQRINVVGNTFNPRQFVRPGTIRFKDCQSCILSSSTLHQFATQEGAVVLENCSEMLVTGLVLSDCDSGLVLKRVVDSTVANCRPAGKTQKSTWIAIDPTSKRIVLSSNAEVEHETK